MALFKMDQTGIEPVPKNNPLSFYELSLSFDIPSAVREQTPLRFW